MQSARALIIVAGLGAMAGSARAAPAAGRPSTPRALFDEGMRLLDEGDVARACPKLADSARLEPRVITKMALAGCYEQLGRTASAWQEYKDVAALASKAGDAEWQRELYAIERTKIMEKKLVRLTVTVAESAPGLVIRRNGQVVPPAQFGVALPVDPGEQVISASAPGRETWTRTVKIAREPATVIAVPSLRQGGPPVTDT